MEVNRYLTDKAMDQIDHALGRPLDPMRESYRNYYVASGEIADAMAASPHWEGGRPQSGGMRPFAVNAAGRKALAAHLREIADPHRAFTVTFDGFSRTVIAVNRDKARYSHFLDVSEVMPDLTFKDYCGRSSVHVGT